MTLLFGLLWPLERLNSLLLGIGRRIAIVALALMVAMILGQVFFRYVLGNAPAWTEEGARFAMLWMTGLMAPLAYRQGGFVAIDMLERALPRLLAGLLTLALLALSLAVLVIARECPVFCVWLIGSMLLERSKDDDDFERTAGRATEGLQAA